MLQNALIGMQKYHADEMKQASVLKQYTNINLEPKPVIIKFWKEMQTKGRGIL